MLKTLTSTDYGNLLRRLLPPGRIWRSSTTLSAFLDGIGTELARVHGRLLDTIEESDPRTVDEMIDAWERVAGLPDLAFPVPVTLADRRLALHAKWIATGGCDEDYYIEVGLAAGKTIVINQSPYSPFKPGISKPGEDVVAPYWAVFIWRVDTDAPQSDELEAALERIKQSHTLIEFVYGSVLYTESGIYLLDEDGDILLEE